VINDSLAKEGLGIIILDAYRPRVIQWLLWEITPDSEFVADPRKGSKHNRGSAVDLTLYNLKTEEELEMPTPFDEFSEQAHHNYQDLSDKVKRNREILKNIMLKNGFEKYDSEWWHYNHIESINYPLRDFQVR
jgi:D-alanyl-D-alanine dipeptidase